MAQFDKHGMRNHRIWFARLIHLHAFEQMQDDIRFEAEKRDLDRGGFDYHPPRNTYRQPVDGTTTLAPWHPHYDSRRNG